MSSKVSPCGWRLSPCSQEETQKLGLPLPALGTAKLRWGSSLKADLCQQGKASGGAFGILSAPGPPPFPT